MPVQLVKKILRYINFAFHITLRYQLAVLAGKSERLHLAEYLESFFAITGYYGLQYEEEPNNQNCKKYNVKSGFSAHVRTKLHALSLALKSNSFLN